MQFIGTTQGKSKVNKMQRISRMNTSVTNHKVFQYQMAYIKCVLDAVNTLYRIGAINDNLDSIKLIDEVVGRISKGMSFAFVEAVAALLTDILRTSDSGATIKATEALSAIMVEWVSLKSDVQVGNVGTEKKLSERIQKIESESVLT